MKTVKTTTIEQCGKVFGGLTSMPCTKPKGHNGLHHGESVTPNSSGTIDWQLEASELKQKKRGSK